ncbi:hypothetical protein GCM10027592_28040 [Spirosoma flavus]
MKPLLKSTSYIALFVLLFSACSKPAEAVVDPDRQSPPAPGVGGKWSYGTFSPSSFWGTDGSYHGAASEQAMAFHFTADGTYELYVMNVATYYGCRTGAYTYWKGKAKFNEDDKSIRLTPAQGTQRGEYSCYPGKNFKRDASDSERTKAHQTLHYAIETDSKGQPALRLYFGDTDQQGVRLTTASW